MERLEEELYMLHDVVEAEEAEKIRIRRRDFESQVPAMANNVQEVQEKGLGMHRRCWDQMKKALRIVGDSLVVLWDLKEILADDSVVL